MPIKIRFFAGLRDATGQREIQIETPKGKIHVLDVLRSLSQTLGHNFERAVLDPETGTVLPHIKIMINGRNIEHLSGLSTAIKEGDVIQILPPIGGG